MISEESIQLRKVIGVLERRINSQQEAIEKLREDIRPYTEEELSKMSFWPNREKGEIAMGEKISEPADDKPSKEDYKQAFVESGASDEFADKLSDRLIDKPEEQKTTENKNIHLYKGNYGITDKVYEVGIADNPATHRTDKLEYEYGNSVTKVKLDDSVLTTSDTDTHRTVTLRIPKGECLGGIILDLAEDKGSLWVYNLSDTDLQKALDEVQE